jgi:hypothetical protein
VSIAGGCIEHALSGRLHAAGTHYGEGSNILAVRGRLDDVEVQQIEARREDKAGNLPHIAFAMVSLSDPIAERAATVMIEITMDGYATDQRFAAFFDYCKWQGVAAPGQGTRFENPFDGHVMSEGNGPRCDPSADFGRHHCGSGGGIIDDDTAQAQAVGFQCWEKIVFHGEIIASQAFSITG